MQMTKDVAALTDYLKLDSAYIIGRSDGAIISLMIGIFYPEKAKRIAAFAANLLPGTTALYPEFVEEVHKARLQAEEMNKIGCLLRN